jgi:hypothetical protein
MGFQQRFIDEPVDGESHRFRRYRHKHHISGVTGSMRAQVLRSSAKWSSGIDTEVRKKKKIKKIKKTSLYSSCNLLAFYSKWIHLCDYWCRTLCLH